MTNTLPNRTADPIRTHIIALRAAGMTSVAIAAHGGVHPSTIRAIHDRRVHRTYGHTAAAILAITPTPCPPRGYTDATRPRRQIQALSAIGWSLKWQRTHTAITPRRMYCLVAAVSRHICNRHADAIDVMYDTLHAVDGPSTYARNHAIRMGWADPAAWNDTTIADPAAQPRQYIGDGLDHYAIDLALSGDHHIAARLTRAERDHAARTGYQRGLGTAVLAVRLHADGRTIQRARTATR